MPTRPEFPLSIFYDGSCSVCASEIEHYIRQDHGGRLVPVDIRSPDFYPMLYGISLNEFLYQLHVIDHRGSIYRGVDAFWAIWQAFPASTLYDILGCIIYFPGINTIARFSYRAFARIRIYLPRRRNKCVTGSCRIGVDKPQ